MNLKLNTTTKYMKDYIFIKHLIAGSGHKLAYIKDNNPKQSKGTSGIKFSI